jgi:hypothetical protein
VYAFSLSKEFGRVVFCEKEMVQSGRDSRTQLVFVVLADVDDLLYPQPLSEFLIFRLELCYRILLADLLEQVG